MFVRLLLLSLIISFTKLFLNEKQIKKNFRNYSNFSVSPKISMLIYKYFLLGNQQIASIFTFSLTASVLKKVMSLKRKKLTHQYIAKNRKNFTY